MIDELLFKTNHLGKDGFIWWIGQIPERKEWGPETNRTNLLDPNKAAKTWPERCKVRIIGYHSFNKKELESKDLPWAHIMLDPSLGSGQGSEGITSNLTGGEICFGFFLDGEDAQQPVVVGLLARPPQVKNEPEDLSFAFRPFSGHSGTIPPTKREKIEPSGPGSTSSPSPPIISVPESLGLGVNQLQYGSGIGDWVPFSGISSNIRPFSESINYNLIGIGSTAFSYNLNLSDGIWTTGSSFAIGAYLKTVTVTSTPPSPCNNNLIGQITQILQDFIGLTNTFQKYANTYIDPVLNEIVDIASTIKSTASSIGGIIRLIINSIRSSLFKCIVSLFKKFLGIVPDPTRPIISPAVKNILNIIYCLFEKLIPNLLDFIEGLLSDMLDTVFSAPICAINQWVTGVLTQVMTSIESILDPVLSGINWLTGGLSNVFGVLNQVSSVANQIYNFIGCDDLKCTTPSKWVSNIGPIQQSSDNWNKVVKDINVFKGTADGLDSVEQAIAGLSLYNKSSIYDKCNQQVNNPTTQNDLPTLYPGIKFAKCIPPIISVYGDGYGAVLEPIVSSSRIIGVNIVSSGFDFKTTPLLTVIDNSGYGSGAKLQAKLNDAGSIGSVIVLEMGSGYCPGTITAGIGSTSTADTNTIINIQSSKDRIYEGESVTFTVTSSDKENEQVLDYSISGIESKFINQPLSGTLTLTQGSSNIQIDTISDDVVNTKKIKFDIVKFNKSKTVVVEDFSENPINKTSEFVLTSSNYNLNEGTPFTITLTTKNIEDSTLIPFKISGVDSRLIENYDSYMNFKVVNNKAEIKFRTNKGIIQNDQIFRLELENKKASIGILIYKVNEIPKIEPKLCLTGLEVLRPGIGYSINDTATDGINTYQLIISPDNGAVFGAKPLTNTICGYELPPVIRINTLTGIGAEIVPIMKLDTNNSNSILNQNNVGIGSMSEVLNIVDCI